MPKQVQAFVFECRIVYKDNTQSLKFLHIGPEDEVFTMLSKALADSSIPTRVWFKSAQVSG